MQPRQWEIQTPVGKFRFKHASDMISLGGKDFCVQISYDGPDNSTLVWLGTRNAKCELNNLPIFGKKTQQMVYLAVTLFRVIYPNVSHINLIDSSTFTCDLPDGKKHSISMKESYFLFHGKTFYEDKFGAVPILETDLHTMSVLRNALSDPSKKPERFEFLNATLTPFLDPIYKLSLTWRDFFQGIQSKWEDKKCSVIYAWYRRALSCMHKGTIPDHWRINITKFPIIHPIKFERIPVNGNVAKRNTRKTRKSQKYYPMEGGWDGGVAMSADWTAFLRT